VPLVPFVFTTVWLANTASLVLPVSNLTNLLAMRRLDSVDTRGFVALLGPSALVAIVTSVVLLALFFRRGLAGRYDTAPPPRVHDRPLLITSGVVVAALLPLLVSGLEPWIPAAAAAVVLGAVFLWRSPRTLRIGLVPWQLVVFASGLFLAVGAVEALGVERDVLHGLGKVGRTVLPERLQELFLPAFHRLRFLVPYSRTARPVEERRVALLLHDATRLDDQADGPEGLDDRLPAPVVDVEHRTVGIALDGLAVRRDERDPLRHEDDRGELRREERTLPVRLVEALPR